MTAKQRRAARKLAEGMVYVGALTLKENLLSALDDVERWKELARNSLSRNDAANKYWRQEIERALAKDEGDAVCSVCNGTGKEFGLSNSRTISSGPCPSCKGRAKP